MTHRKAIWTEFNDSMDAHSFVLELRVQIDQTKAELAFIELNQNEHSDIGDCIPMPIMMLSRQNPKVKIVFNSELRNHLSDCGFKIVDFKSKFNASDRIMQLKVDSVESVNGRHDAVLIWTRSGVHSNAQMYGGRLEVEFVIGSLRRFCSSWLNRIILVGDEPDRELDVDVFIKVENVYKTTKAANIWNKIRSAIVGVKDLTDDFVFVSDDQIVVKETKWDDIVPMYSREVSADMLCLDEDDYIDRSIKPNIMDVSWERTWHRISYRTFKKFFDGTHGVKQFEPHIWMKFNKFNFLKMCDLYDYVNDIGCLTETTYYNTFNDGKSEKIKDHVYVGVNKSREYILKISRIKWIEKSKIRWLCWSDHAFEFSEFRKVLGDIIGRGD